MRSRVVSIMLVAIDTTSDKIAPQSPERLKDLITSMVEKFEGRLIKTRENILSIVFESPTAATFAALEIQKSQLDFQSTVPQDSSALRITIHTGETALSHDDIYGNVVDLGFEVLKHTLPGKIVFTESTLVSMTRNRVATSRITTQRFSGYPEPVTLFEVLDSEVLGTSLKKRSYSFFGLIAADIDGNLRRSYPVKFSTRVAAGLLDAWFGIVAALLIPVFFNLPQITGTLFDVERLQIEDFQLHNAKVENASWAGGGKAVDFEREGSASMRFPGPSGSFDIVLAYRGTPRDMNSKFLLVRIGDFTYELETVFRGNYFKLKRIGKNITIQKNEMITLVRKTDFEPSDIDYIEFVPGNSKAFRPIGIERSYRYIDLWRAIGYDDMNVHFSLLPLPAYTFLHMFIFLIFFGQTLGGMIFGIHCREIKNKLPVGVWAAFIRSLSWFLFPILGWTSPLKQRLWTDIASGSELVVYRDEQSEL